MGLVTPLRAWLRITPWPPPAPASGSGLQLELGQDTVGLLGSDLDVRGLWDSCPYNQVTIFWGKVQQLLKGERRLELKQMEQEELLL